MTKKGENQEISYLDHVSQVAMQRLYRAKLRLACYMLAVGGFTQDEMGGTGRAPATDEERSAYGLLYGRLGRELADAYREAFMFGSLAQDRNIKKLCLEFFLGKRNDIWRLLDIDRRPPYAYLDGDEKDFREQLERAMETL